MKKFYAKSNFLQLVEAIKALCLDAESQIKLFPDFVVITDELVLNYDHGFQPLENYLEYGLINQTQAEKLIAIDRETAKMSEEGGCWSLDSLRSDAQWEKLRSLAREALAELNVELDTPSMGGNYLKVRYTGN